jgi:glycosyltransferase involved in cell wall biosynthesis
MKILVIAGFAESLINFRGPLINAMQGKGLDIHVAAPDLTENSPICLQLKAMGLFVHDVPMLRTGINPVADIRTLWTLWFLLNQIAPSIILSYTIKPVIYGTIAAWLARVPQRFALITGLGYAFQNGGGRSHLLRFVQKLYQFALSRASLVFFQNPDDLALFRERGILSKLSPFCLVNGSGVDLNHFSVCPLPSSTASGEAARFLLIGRLLGAKGIREYIQAAYLIKKAHPNVQFTLVGWIDGGPDSISKIELDAWIKDGGINFLGQLSDVRPAIEDSSVYVLPSYREGTPRSVLEAMAMGRPIITTDAPGCRETVIDGENGFLIPVKNVDALVGAMRKFIDDPGLIARMGARSRQIAEEKYDVHKVNAVMLKAMGI